MTFSSTVGSTINLIYIYTFFWIVVSVIFIKFAVKLINSLIAFLNSLTRFYETKSTEIKQNIKN